MPESKTTIRVYTFGCRRPDDESLALQLLGQAFNYAEDLRRASRTAKREKRTKKGEINNAVLVADDSSRKLFENAAE